MSKELINALIRLLDSGDYEQQKQERQVLVLDLLWKLARKDYHGVADCAMDLRELHL